MEGCIKICCKCKENKSVELFYKNKAKKDGYATECKKCQNNRKPYYFDYCKKNKLAINNRSKLHYDKNKEKILNLSKIRYAADKEYKKTYYQNNKVKINERIRKKREDVVVKLRHNVSCAIRQALNKNYSVKNSPTWKKLTYTPQQLKEHLEKQFDSKMSWDNYSTYWVIDHIYPQSKLVYDSLNHPNFLKCWKLDNLRPLEEIENIKKGNRLL